MSEGISGPPPWPREQDEVILRTEGEMTMAPRR